MPSSEGNPIAPLAHVSVLDHGFVELWNMMGSDQIVAASARVSLSRELASLTDHSEKQAERDRGLINRLMRDRHTSPFESVVFQWRVRAPIFVARQWFRHRIGCLTEDTQVSILNNLGTAPKALKQTMEDLWRLWSNGEANGHHVEIATYNLARDARWRLQRMKVRVLNEKTGEFEAGQIKEIINSGVKPVYRVSIEGGYTIKMTADHRVLTNEGWKTLREAVGLSGDRESAIVTRDAFFMINGIHVYRDKEWLKQHREQGLGVQKIAEEAGCSYHTIRKWLRIFGLSFTDEETRFASGHTPWNQGLRGYKLNRVFSKEERQQLRDLHSGENSNFWRGGTTTERERVGAWTRSVAAHVHARFNHTCHICLKSGKTLHAHHAIPVWLDPNLALEFGNLVSLCDECHRQLHQDRDAELGFANHWQPDLALRPEMFPVKVGRRLKAHAMKVVSVEYVGLEQTYDLVMQGPWHNFVANNIVVHNSFNEESGRYVELQDEFFAPAQLRVRVGKAMDYQYVDMEPAQNAAFLARIEALYRDARTLYEDMLQAGVAREHARMVLPVAQYTTFIWTVNALSLMNFLHLRNSPHAQAEIRAYAEIMEAVFAERLPWTHAAFRSHWGVAMMG